MSYCTRCGGKNADDAKFCNACGAPLGAAYSPRGRQWDNDCDKECGGTSRRGSSFWAIIVVLIGLWIIFEFGIRNIQGLPPALADFQLWWIFPIIIGIVVIVAGINMIRKQA